MLIEIKGVQFVNKGAYLMLCAIMQQIGKRWPDAEIALRPNPNSPYLQRASLGAYQKLVMRKNRINLNPLSNYIPTTMRYWLKQRWGVVTDADIDLVLDASGFAYGDQWPALSIRALAQDILHKARHNRPYILLPQAFGPFSRPQERKLLAKTLPHAALICARETESLSHLRDIVGNSSNLALYPDFTNLVEGTPPAEPSKFAESVLIIPNNTMLAAKNSHKEWQTRYLPQLLALIEVVKAEQLTPILLNHEGANDAAICQQIQAASSSSIALINEADPLKVKGLIGASRAVISSRFHGCVSALAQGVPCLGTSWSHKYEQLFAQYHQSAALIKPNHSTEDLQAAFHSALNSSSNSDYSAARAEFHNQALAMWEQIGNLVP